MRNKFILKDGHQEEIDFLSKCYDEQIKAKKETLKQKKDFINNKNKKEDLKKAS